MPAQEDLALGLRAQKAVSEANLPGSITFTRLERGTAEFQIEDSGINHRLMVGETYYRMTANADGDDYDLQDWLDRAEASTFGPRVSESTTPARMRSHYTDHQDIAVTSSVFGASVFKEHADAFGVIDREDRTAELIEDGTTYTLDLSSDEPGLKVNDTVLHPSMAGGFLMHMANRTRRGNADSFVKDLREVLSETDRRLIR